MDMTSIRILQTGYWGHVDFQIRLDGSKVYQTLFSYTMDICNMVLSIKDSIFKKWFRSLLNMAILCKIVLSIVVTIT